MGDQWEARISVIENIQEEFRHNIREIKERLARLTALFEKHIKTVAAHPQNPSLLPNQQIPQPFIPTTSHLLPELIALTYSVQSALQRARQFAQKHPCLAIHRATRRTAKRTKS